MKFEQFLDDPVIKQISDVTLPVDINDSYYAPTVAGQRQASVLMPLVNRGNDWHVLFTRRPMHMPSHPGQISFPGGRVEQGETPLQAALRETHEEIGVSADYLFPIGRLKSFDAVSNYRVTPFIGLLDASAEIIPEPGEVDEVFELPFSFLMNKENHKPRSADYKGRTYKMYDMPWPDKTAPTHNVWGMTAMMIYRLYQRGFKEGAHEA